MTSDGHLTEDDFIAEARNYNELVELKKDIEFALRESERVVLSFLKRRKWDSYTHPQTGISVRVHRVLASRVDEKQMRIVLNKSDFAQCVVREEKEQISVVTPENRKRLNKDIKRRLGKNESFLHP